MCGLTNRSSLKIKLLLLLLAFFTLSTRAVNRAESKREKIAEIITAANARGDFNGVALIAVGDRIIYKNAVGLASREWKIPFSVNTKMRFCSVTKQFTTMLIMQLVADGKLSLDKTISDYLPEYRKETGGKIHLRDLLNSSSGLPTFDDSAFYQSDDEQLRDVNFVVKKYLSGDLTFEPGAKFNYNNADFIILGAIIERISGKTFEQNLREKILTPLAMKNTGVFDENIVENLASGYARKNGKFILETAYRMQNYYAAAAMYGTLDDLFLWDRALMTNKLLSKELTTEMFTPSAKLGFVALGSWVYSLKLGDGKKHKFVERQGNVGGFCNLNIIAPDDDWTVILLSNTETEALFRTYTGEGLSAEILKVLAEK